MQREKMIDYIAHAMKEYDDRRAKHTWRELAEVAYFAHMECISVSSSHPYHHEVNDANLVFDFEE